MGGNLVDMVRCTQYMKIIKRDGIADHITKVGDHMIAKLREMSKETDSFSSVRGKGSLIAFTMQDADHRDAMINSLKEAFVIALPCGTRSVRFRLPLIMTIEEADELLSRTSDALQSMQVLA